MIKIYFAGSIRGGRDDQQIYYQIIEFLKKDHTVLTEHISDVKLTATGEDGDNDQWIYERDMQWLNDADALVAEVTNPSLGVGYEIGKAEEAGKMIICLFRENAGRNLSAMIAGNNNIKLIRYTELSSMLKELSRNLESIKHKV